MKHIDDADSIVTSCLSWLGPLYDISLNKTTMTTKILTLTVTHVNKANLYKELVEIFTELQTLVHSTFIVVLFSSIVQQFVRIHSSQQSQTHYNKIHLEFFQISR